MTMTAQMTALVLTMRVSTLVGHHMLPAGSMPSALPQGTGQSVGAQSVLQVILMSSATNVSIINFLASF